MKKIFTFAILILIVQSACSFLVPAPVADPPAKQSAVTPESVATEAPAATATTAATEAPAATATTVATEAPSAVEPVAESVIKAPQQWNGTFSKQGAIQSTSLTIEEVNGDLFKGKLTSRIIQNGVIPPGANWTNDNTRYFTAIIEVEGEIVTDFSKDESRWLLLEDYKNGDQTGVWLKWTEKAIVSGLDSVVGLGSWYYGHATDKEMTAIAFINATDSQPLKNSKLELALVEPKAIDLPPLGAQTVTIDSATLSAPHQWNGTYVYWKKQRISLIILEADESSFRGQMSWGGDNPALTKMNGYFLTDFKNETEADLTRWNFHEDYKNGDRSGTWVKWTETQMIKGGNYTMNGWYYAHVRSDGSMVGIYFYNETDPAPDTTSYFILNLVR